MASQIPQSPQRPGGRGRQRAFWRGALVGFCVFVGIYIAFGVAVKFRIGTGVSSIQTRCDSQQLMIKIDGDTHAVRAGEAKIWKITDPNIFWNCRTVDFFNPMTCQVGTEYVLVLRYPDNDETSIRCEIRESSSDPLPLPRNIGSE